MRSKLRTFSALALTGLVLAGCSERNVLGPEALEPVPVPLDAGMRRLVCEANVRAATVACTEVAASLPDGVSADRIIGGQDIYVRLSSSGTTYDSGTEIFQTSVTVQNLTQAAIGTPDGSTTAGVHIFFHDGPTVTDGTGTALVANSDGTATFTGADQRYFLYNQILTPLQISDARTWQFNVPSTVNTFSFTVFVSAPMVNETAPLQEAVWNGSISTAWVDGPNWQNNTIPDSLSSVIIPPSSQFPGAMPALSGQADVANLRVGSGSTLDLAANTINVSGNLDAPGTITNGSTRLTGSSALLRGNVNALEVTGSAKLQGVLTASGSVSISGTLTTSGHAITIIIP